MCAICLGVMTTSLGGSNIALAKSKKYIKIKDFFSERKLYLIILSMLGIFAFLPILAPIFQAIGFSGLAAIIYGGYFFFCHQRASHSFHIFNYQFAYCARDTAIWTTVFFINLIRYYFYFKPIKWYYAVLLSVPMLLDGGTQFFAYLNNATSGGSIFYESSNLSRTITGALFGIAIGGSLIAYLTDTVAPHLQEGRKHIKMLSATILTFTIAALFFIIIYVAEVLQVLYIQLQLYLIQDLETMDRHS